MNEKHAIKVLVVPPIYGGAAPIARYVYDAFTRMVPTTFAAMEDFYPRLEAISRLDSQRSAQALPSFFDAVESMLWTHVQATKPDLVLGIGGAPLTARLLGRLRRKQIRSALWFVEDFRRFDYWQSKGPLVDLLFTIQKEPFFGLLRQLNVRKFAYLPLACEPSRHRTLALSSDARAQYGAAIGFMGSPYPNRVHCFEALNASGLGIWGKGWDDVQGSVTRCVREGTRTITDREEVDIYNACSVVLNLHSDTQSCPPREGDFVNPRTFVAAGCGAAQLVDERLLLSDHFEPGKELITFSSMAELREQADRLLHDASLCRTIGANAQRRAYAEHTYDHRIKAILEAFHDL